MRNTALVVSFIFHPIFLPTAGLVAIFSLNTYIAQTTPMPKQFLLLGWIFINTTIIPILFTLFLKWRDMVSSFQLHARKERIVPFAFALILYIANFLFMREIPLPAQVHSLFLGSSIAVGLALFFTFFTKISIHMIGMGGLTASIYGIVQVFNLPIIALVMLGIILSGIVGSARYILESHDLRQIYLGWITGFVAVYLPLIYGWV